MSKACFLRAHVSAAALRAAFSSVKELGQGSFGMVKLVRRRLSPGEMVISKTVNTTNMLPQTLERARHEIHLLKQLDHPNIVRIFEYADDQPHKQLMLILEYLPGGDCAAALKPFANKGLGLPESLTRQAMQQVLHALAYCHGCGIAHLDVKLENIVFARPPTETTQQPVCCKLIDFGLAARCGSAVIELMGTPAYMAPEVSQKKCKSVAASADLWAVAVCTLYLLTGKLPFGNTPDYNGQIQPVFERIAQYSSFEVLLSGLLEHTAGWAQTSSPGRTFCRALLHSNPSRRPMAKIAVEHAWFRAPLGQQETLAMPEACSMEVALCNVEVFLSASRLARQCQIAATALAPTLEVDWLAEVFLSLDYDGDGELSFDDLNNSLPSSANFCARDLWLAAELNERGSISFTVFAAAARFLQAGGPEGAGSTVFSILDADGDGVIHPRDVRFFFRHSGLMDEDFSPLPSHRPLKRAEWLALLEAVPTETSTITDTTLSSTLQSAASMRSAGDVSCNPVAGFPWFQDWFTAMCNGRTLFRDSSQADDDHKPMVLHPSLPTGARPRPAQARVC